MTPQTPIRTPSVVGARPVPVESPPGTDLLFNFDDIKPLVFKVRYQGKDYYLREATGAAAIDYRNALTNSAQFDGNGKPTGVKNIATAELILVAGCLCEQVSTGRENKLVPVPRSLVDGMPYQVVKTLYDKIKEISYLDETEADLERQLKHITERLARMRADKEGGPPKDGASDTTDGSSSPPA